MLVGLTQTSMSFAYKREGLGYQEASETDSR